MGGGSVYQYFNGLVIREGTDGIPAESVETLFEDARDGQGILQLGKKSNIHIFSKTLPAHLLFGIKIK